MKSVFYALLGTAALFAAVPAHAQSNDGQNRRIELHNHTGTTIREFYASTTNRTSWQEDVLGRRTLPPSGTMTINIDDGSGRCMYDVRIIFSNGAVQTLGSVNVCTARVIDAWPNGIRIQ